MPSLERPRPGDEKRPWSRCEAKEFPLVLVSVPATCTAAQRMKGVTVVVAIDLRERKRLEMDLRQAQEAGIRGTPCLGHRSLNQHSSSVHQRQHPFLEGCGAGPHWRASEVAGGGPVCPGRYAIDRGRGDGPRGRGCRRPSLPPGECPQALDRCLDGLDRVATIVRSMKEFAHPDSKEKEPIDLNRAIASTITIARNEYKYVAEVETDFAELPPVMCHPGELNQVILNIVVNAAHAIGDAVAGTDHRGRIAVRTSQEGGDVVISIADTGSGIPPAIREHIFDPFFTTKEVGKGTGQGLAIARSVVVDMHHGKLTFESEVGKGTTFFIRLPLTTTSGIRRAPQPVGGPL